MLRALNCFCQKGGVIEQEKKKPSADNTNINWEFVVRARRRFKEHVAIRSTDNAGSLCFCVEPEEVESLKEALKPFVKDFSFAVHQRGTDWGHYKDWDVDWQRKAPVKLKKPQSFVLK